MVLFATGRPGAADEARTVLEIQGWRGDLSMYAVLLGHFAARRDGRKDHSRRLLDEAAAKCDASTWPYPIIKHLRGDLDEAGLLAAVSYENEWTEAQYYLGLQAVEQGRADAAIAHFRQVKERANRWSMWYSLSVAELDRLLAEGAEGDGP